jgi:hypothetical protein
MIVGNWISGRKRLYSNSLWRFSCWSTIDKMTALALRGYLLLRPWPASGFFFWYICDFLAPLGSASGSLCFWHCDENTVEM